MSQNQRDMEQSLKDANLYEENMSEEQVMSYYNAIKESEMSATEIQNKSMNESVNELLTAMNESENLNTSSVKERLKNEVNKVFKPKGWFHAKKNVLSTVKETVNTESNNNDDRNESEMEIISNDQENAPPNQSRVVLDDDADIFNKLQDNVSHRDDGQASMFEKLKSGGIKIQTIKVDNFKNNNQIGFNDMPKSVNVEKNMLIILSHELKMINIQNSKKFLSANNENRIKMLFEYHVASEKLRGKIARLSRVIAPLPKPITNTDSSNTVTSGGSQEQKSPVHPSVAALREDESERFVDFISRSGRHTKRKIYLDEDSQEGATSMPKKPKTNSEEWISKNQVKVARLPKKSDLVSSTTNNNNDKDFLGEEPDENKPKKPLGRPKSAVNKRLSNDEIIQRCGSLFSDTPSRKRSGAMVTAGIEEENRRKKEAEKIEEFQQSLQVNTEEEEEEPEDLISVDDERIEVEEVPFERKRVSPPLLVGGRRAINNRKRKEDATTVEALGITTAKKLSSSISSSSDDFEPVNGNGSTNNGNKRTIGRKNSINNNVERSEASSSTSKGGRGGKAEDMVVCPLCSLPFPKKNIEEHAATCGEELVTQSTPRNTRITCPECDSVIVTDYQGHVDYCKKQKNSK